MKDESSGQAASALSLSKGAGASKIRPCFDRLSMPEGRSVWLSGKRPELVEGCGSFKDKAVLRQAQHA